MIINYVIMAKKLTDEPRNKLTLNSMKRQDRTSLFDLSKL